MEIKLNKIIIKMIFIYIFGLISGNKIRDFLLLTRRNSPRNFLRLFCTSPLRSAIASKAFHNRMCLSPRQTDRSFLLMSSTGVYSQPLHNVYRIQQTTFLLPFY